VAALNSNAVPLAQRAFNAISEESHGISSKQIAVGLAAKYSFDLRNCLGTILQPKFDFTGVSGIKKAYKAVFSESESLLDALDELRLNELEATRHLIVHRAGIVDEEYSNRISGALPVGAPLELDEKKVREFVELASLAGGAILVSVDRWLCELPGLSAGEVSADGVSPPFIS
jgi:hypothetical protein